MPGGFRNLNSISRSCSAESAQHRSDTSAAPWASQCFCFFFFSLKWAEQIKRGFEWDPQFRCPTWERQKCLRTRPSSPSAGLAVQVLAFRLCCGFLGTGKFSVSCLGAERTSFILSLWSLLCALFTGKKKKNDVCHGKLQARKVNAA